MHSYCAVGLLKDTFRLLGCCRNKQTFNIFHSEKRNFIHYTVLFQLIGIISTNFSGHKRHPKSGNYYEMFGESEGKF